MNASFIVAVNAEGLWIIDQHVAHERVLFEQHLRARREGELGGQRLLMPIVVELTPRQLVTFEQIADELSRKRIRSGTAWARGAWRFRPRRRDMPDRRCGEAAAEILDGVARENQAISIDSLQAQIAASTACHAAIKVNMPLDTTKMEWLLASWRKPNIP